MSIKFTLTQKNRIPIIGVKKGYFPQPIRLFQIHFLEEYTYKGESEYGKLVNDG